MLRTGFKFPLILRGSCNNIIANLQEYNTEDGEVSITITQINGKVNKIEFIFPTSVSTNMSLGTENTTNKDIYETTFTITKDETVYRHYATGAANRYKELFTQERMIEKCMKIYMEL